jgi:hypothetical protein
MNPWNNRWQYRQQRRMWRQQRRYGRGSYGFPWFLIVLGIILIASLHQIFGVIAAVFLFIVAAWFIRRLFFSGNSWSNPNQNWQQPPQQTPYYQPRQQQSTPYYQPPQSAPEQPQTPYYQPYNQGYQAGSYQQAEQPKETQPEEYTNYDQPQVRYPEAMPPQEQ